MKQQAVFGGGCFWCVEAVFQALKGIHHVESGYAGGTAETANYPMVCTGQTGHAEVVRLEYDTSVIDYSTLLDVFFATHDPTTLNRQGNDVGTQYRSVIFYLDENQRILAEQKMAELKGFGIYVVTQLAPMPVFYRAEEEHQNFYATHPTQGYCNAVIPPKLAKLRQNFVAYLR